jgi:hypothetical protein
MGALRKVPPESGPCFVNGTMEERLALVWPLTVEVVSLHNKYDPEQVRVPGTPAAGARPQGARRKE